MDTPNYARTKALRNLYGARADDFNHYETSFNQLLNS